MIFASFEGKPFTKLSPVPGRAFPGLQPRQQTSVFPTARQPDEDAASETHLGN